MIKFNIINGFLGVGKTTSIRYLLQQKPTNEKWAIVVNEYGEIGIDESLIESNETYTVAQIPGGCICCSVNSALDATLHEIIKNEKPDRVLIEPSGIGHPANVVDSLKKGIQGIGELKAIITLINPNHLSQERYLAHETYIDQVNLADILIANKTDLCTKEELDHFYTWGQSLFPPKQIINHTKHGKIDATYLDIDQEHVRNAEFPESHNHHHHHDNNPIKADPYLPVKYENTQLGLKAFGLLFHEKVVFKLGLLEELLHSVTGTERVKGVFRTERGWYSYNQTGNEITAFHPSAYRKDSRIEIIAIDSQELDLSKFSEVMERTILSYEG